MGLAFKWMRDLLRGFCCKTKSEMKAAKDSCARMYYPAGICKSFKQEGADRVIYADLIMIKSKLKDLLEYLKEYCEGISRIKEVFKGEDLFYEKTAVILYKRFGFVLESAGSRNFGENDTAGLFVFMKNLNFEIGFGIEKKV